MNKIWFSIVGIALVSRCPVSAQLEGPMITVVATSIETGAQSLIDGQDILRAALAPYQETLPASYRYIHVFYTGTTLTSEQHELLQQAIYLGLIDNKKLTLRLSDGLTAFQAKSLFKKWTGRTITTVSGNKPLTDTDRDRIVHRLQARYSVPSDLSFLNQDAQLSFVLSDAYRKIRHEYLHTDKVTDTQLVQGAIKGMVEATNDPYTTYFPPADAQQFIDSIQGEFFGIGAYIEMKGPGVLLIVSPLAGTPAERAGLLPGDQIMAIDGELIEETMSLSAAIAKIKGPEHTTVTLSIMRDGTPQDIDITREKIVIKPLTTKEIDSDTLSVSITTFPFGLDTIFADMVEDTIVPNDYNNLIIDLRNNPGGSLDDVERILSYFVPKDDTIVTVKSSSSTESSHSSGVATGQYLGDKNIAILVNKGSASASEIMAGVVREYAPHASIVGETSFGKGTVQSLWDYADGSSIKITTAQWLYGNSQTSIDHKGIVPDYEVVDDPATKLDEVMEWVRRRW